MALFRKSRRNRVTDASKTGRRETRPAAPPPTPLLEQLRTIAAGVEMPEDALEPALRAIVESTGAVGGALCLYDSRHSVLRLSAEIGISDEGCRRLRTIRRGDPGCWDIPLHGVVNRRAYLIENASQNRYVPPLVGGNAGMRTIACIPVYSGLSALASLVLVSAPPRTFAERDITMLWKPLRELAGMIEAVRRRVGPADPNADVSGPPSLDSFAATAERDRLRTELAGRSAEFERLTLQLTTNRDEVARLRAELESATTERGEIARELERVRTASEETTTLADALAEAERERTRLVEALEAAAREAEAREARAIALARQEAETEQTAREAEWEAARRTHAEQLAASERLAEERGAEVARLTTRVSALETGAVAERGRDTRRDGEIARVTAALEAAAARETDLRARLAAREAERVGAADSELAAAREALAVAEAGRARAEERAASLDAELDTMRRALESAHAELAQAREEIAELRESTRGAVAESERHQRTLAEAQRIEAEVRSRLEAAEHVLGEVTAARDRANEEARSYQSAVAHAEARLEAIAAERDQLRETLARTEAECLRLRSALEAAQGEAARVEALLAHERTEQARVAERLTEAEATVARLEAVTAEQRNELVEREAEIVRLTAQQAELLTQRDQLLSARDVTEALLVDVDTTDLEAAALVSPDAPTTVTRSDAGVTVIAVQSASAQAEIEFVSTGAPVVVVLDGDRAWTRIGIEGHDVAVVKPSATSVTRVTELQPVRIIANLAAPGAITSLLALRAGGSTERLWGCIADAERDTAIQLSAIEPVVGPIDPDAIIAALGPYAARDGRIVTTGADVDALMSLRQALSRRRASVSMAWDAKQAREMLGVVRPHAVVVDMSMPKRDGCAIVAALAGLDPVPLVVLVTSAGDPALDFQATLADPPRDTVVRTLAQVIPALAAANDETMPRVGQKPITKLQVAQGPRWVG
jgi:CheY-like chemotaxis protein